MPPVRNQSARDPPFPGIRAMAARCFHRSAFRAEKRQCGHYALQACPADRAAMDAGGECPRSVAVAIVPNRWHKAKAGMAPGSAGSDCPERSRGFACPAATRELCEV